jgi:hypothetical protein
MRSMVEGARGLPRRCAVRTSRSVSRCAAAPPSRAYGARHLPETSSGRIYLASNSTIRAAVRPSPNGLCARAIAA